MKEHIVMKLTRRRRCTVVVVVDDRVSKAAAELNIHLFTIKTVYLDRIQIYKIEFNRLTDMTH